MGFGRAKEDRPTPPEVYNWRIYAVSLGATLGGWMFGYNNSVIGGTMVLPAFVRDFALPDSDSASYTTVTSNIVSFVQVGAIFGSLLVFPLLQLWGRRPALGLGAVVFFAGSALQTFSTGRMSLLYGGRALSGVGLGFITVAVPMYIGELAPPAIRGSLVGLYEINGQLASFWGFWGNYFTDIGIPSTQSRQWMIPLGVQMIPAGLLVLALVTGLLPESPRWLLDRGRAAEARRVLSRLRCLPPDHVYIADELDRASAALERQRRLLAGRSRLSVVRELGWPGNRNRLVLGCLLMWCGNLTGGIGVNAFAPSIFESIGIRGTARHLFLSGFYSLARVITTALGLLFFIDMAGRRRLLLVASVGVVISLGYIAIFNTVTVNETDKGAAGIVAVVAVFAFAVSFSSGWTGVPWVYCAEIFPSRIKEMAVCITTWHQWIAQFLVTRLTPYMLAATPSGNVLFFVFSGITICSGIFVFFFIPETRGKTLEDMDAIFGTPYTNDDEEAPEAVIELKQTKADGPAQPAEAPRQPVQLA